MGQEDHRSAEQTVASMFRRFRRTLSTGTFLAQGLVSNGCDSYSNRMGGNVTVADLSRLQSCLLRHDDAGFFFQGKGMVRHVNSLFAYAVASQSLTPEVGMMAAAPGIA